MSGKDDVFDEDLMRELGLDPSEIEQVKAPKPAVPSPTAAARATAEKVSTSPPTAAKPATVSPTAKKNPEGGASTPPAATSNPGPSRTAVPAAREPVSAEKLTESIPVHLAAVIAKRSLPLKDVMSLRAGDVVEFKKLPQEPMDLVANGKLVAKAELVLVDGKIAARLVKIMK